RLRGTAVPDAVGEDDEVFRRIEQLSGAKELAGEGLSQELRAAAGGAVQHQDGRGAGSPQGPVMQPQLRQRLSGGKAEVAQDEVALAHRERRQQESSHGRSLPRPATLRIRARCCAGAEPSGTPAASREDIRARPAVQPVEPTDRTCPAESGPAASAPRPAGLLLEGPVASQEPAMISTKPAAVPGGKVSPSSVTP